MRQILERLNALPFFDGLAPRTLEAIAECASWHSIAGGWTLFEQGEASSTLYFVLTGRLVVVRHENGEEEVVGYIGSGEPVGEISLLSGAPHSASVHALRDSEVIAIAGEKFERLMRDHADLTGGIAALALSRARAPRVLSKRASPRVFALIATSRSIDVNDYARRIASLVSSMGLRVKRLEIAETAPDAVAFDRDEEAHDVTIVPTRVEDSAWYRFALRHADRFFVLARRDARPPRPFPMVTAAGERARKFRLVDLVMIHEGLPACPVKDWIDAIGAARVFHCRADACLGRLARIVAGRSVAIVLSGGGARAYAHIGAIRAIRERGLEIDLAGGASMGAVIAACVAMGWSDAEIDERIRDAFVSSNPLGDHVLPVVALTRGRLVEERLKAHFADALIEEVELPFFCVSSDLTEGRVFVHRQGLLREALRASVSLPGILPPVVSQGALLVDGAVMNNFPTDVMAGMHRGLTIGVDVGRRGTITPDDYVDPPGFFAWVRAHGFRSAPPIVALLMRSATARNEATAGRQEADVMIAPLVKDVELRDWKKYDKAVADGYEATKKALDGASPAFERLGQAGIAGRAAQ